MAQELAKENSLCYSVLRACSNNAVEYIKIGMLFLISVHTVSYTHTVTRVPIKRGLTHSARVQKKTVEYIVAERMSTGVLSARHHRCPLNRTFRCIHMYIQSSENK